MSEVKELLQDKFLVEQSNKITKILLEGGEMDINTVCKVVKRYQKQYSDIKEFNPELAQQFDAIMFWKVMCPNF
jgi:hypothetical protein